MSIQEVERVMQRALREEAFRDLLRDNPGAALASYELTPEERETLLRAGAAGAAGLSPELIEQADPSTLARDLAAPEPPA
jgi:hypothetical protein